MLTDEDLKTKQTTFTRDSDGCWYDAPAWDFQIRKHNGKLALFSYCEVAGETELISDEIDDIEHLRFMLNELSDSDFNTFHDLTY